MKKITSILFALLLMLSLSVSSCMDDFDTPVTGNAYGNNSIKEQRTTSIANLKEKYAAVISGGKYEQLTEETRIVGVVIADDESGNFYKQIVVGDESGSIQISINANGIYACCPVGQKVVIDCTGLCIGGYGSLAQIGTPYNGSIGRMDLELWQEHVRLLNEPRLWYEELKPLALTAETLNTLDKAKAPLLVVLNNVTFQDADGTTVYAGEDDIEKGNAVERTIQFEDGTSTLVLRTSKYANFANEILPQGKLQLTGILSRFNTTWQFTLRTLEDVKINN